MSISDALVRLGIDLPPAARPIAAYIPVRIAGGLAFVSGQLPMEDGKVLHAGRVGDDVTIEEAAQGARRAALQAIAALGDALGSVDRVRGIVQVSVFVACTPSFTDHPKVANGASEVLADLLGDAGRHARVAVGVASLPLGASVEVAVTAIVD